MSVLSRPCGAHRPSRRTFAKDSLRGRRAGQVLSPLAELALVGSRPSRGAPRRANVARNPHPGPTAHRRTAHCEKTYPTRNGPVRGYRRQVHTRPKQIIKPYAPPGTRLQAHMPSMNMKCRNDCSIYFIIKTKRHLTLTKYPPCQEFNTAVDTTL